MKLKKLALLLTLGATLMGGTVFAAGSPDSPFKPDEQVLYYIHIVNKMTY